MTGEAVRGAAFLLRDAMLDIEAGKHAPDAPVSAHGDGIKIEYDDGRAYQLHTQELVAGQGMHPQDPAAAIKALEGCEVWVRVPGADRQAGRRRFPTKQHIATALPRMWSFWMMTVA